MQRFLFPILFVIVLVAPFAVRRAVSDGSASSGAAAPRAGSGPPRRLVIVTPHNRDILLEYERAFSDWHARRYGQPVEISYVLPGATNEIVRLLANTYSVLRRPDGTLPPPQEIDAQTQYDLVWGGGDFVFNSEIEPLGALQAIELPAEVMSAAFPEPRLAGVALYDQDDDDPKTPDAPGMSWVGVCLSSFGIVYSPFYFDRLNAAPGPPLPPPMTWQDLTHPKLANRLALADPSTSGSAAVAYVMVLQRTMADAEAAYLAGGGNKGDAAYGAALEAGWKQGMGDLLLIAANARYFTDSAARVPADVSSAAAAAGMAIDFYGRVEQELAGEDRIRFVSPPAATAITPDPVAILYGTTGERLETATRFIEFLLSPEGQRLWITQVGAPGGPTQRALRRPPIRRDVYGDQSDWTDGINPFAEAGGFNQRQEWMVEFTETRMVWQVAWIETQEALRAAYAAVLADPDVERREALTAQLRDLPISLSDVRAMRAERKRQPKGGEPAWAAQARIELARKFEAHYEAVEAAARAAR